MRLTEEQCDKIVKSPVKQDEQIEIANVGGISIKKNSIGLSDKEALLLLGGLATTYSEGWDALGKYIPDKLDNNGSVEEELLIKLGVSKEDVDKFISLF